MLTDIEIARQATLIPITEVAKNAGVPDEALIPYGKYKAKVDTATLPTTSNGKLILVTAVNPTPAGEGKTTTSVGL
jgi:formate--tetrahydrofolate ligase